MHLGIHLIVEKAWKRIFILRQYKFLLNRKVLQRMYFSFIRPLLEYGDIVWSNCTDEQSNSLESIQLEAARIVTGAPNSVKSANCIKNYSSKSKWTQKTPQTTIVLFYKMNNSIVPNYLQSMLLTSNQSTYTLRNNSELTQVYFKTTLYRESFLPSTVHEWNNLPIATKYSLTLTSSNPIW
jgi:hypothetical protein